MCIHMILLSYYYIISYIVYALKVPRVRYTCEQNRQCRLQVVGRLRMVGRSRGIYYRWSTGSRRYFASPRPPGSSSPGGPACRVPFPSSGTPGRSSVPGGLACFAPAPLAGIPGRPASTSATLYACPACAAVIMPSVRRTTEVAPSTSATATAAAATATAAVAAATNNLRLLLL